MSKTQERETTQLPESVRLQIKALQQACIRGIRALGVCYVCRHAMAEPGRSLCEECRSKAERWRRAAGMQPRTEKPPAEVSRQAREQRANREAGLCRQCRTPSPDRALCDRCRAKQKARRQAKPSVTETA